VSTDVTLRLTVSSDGGADSVESVRPDLLEEPAVLPAAVGVGGPSGSAGDAASAPAAVRSARLFAPPTPAPLSASVPNVSDAPAIEVSATSGPATIDLPSRRLTAPAPPPAAPVPTPVPAVKRDPAPAVVHAPAGPLRVGALTVLRRTVIPYPPYAKQARVSGTVSVEVTIGADGRVRNAVAISGPELLRIAAQGVKDWRFQAPVVGGKPVEAIGRVDVTFTPLVR
jgi:protein TonB